MIDVIQAISVPRRYSKKNVSKRLTVSNCESIGLRRECDAQQEQRRGDQPEFTITNHTIYLLSNRYAKRPLPAGRNFKPLWHSHLWLLSRKAKHKLDA